MFGGSDAVATDFPLSGTVDIPMKLPNTVFDVVDQVTVTVRWSPLSTGVTLNVMPVMPESPDD